MIAELNFMTVGEYLEKYSFIENVISEHMHLYVEDGYIYMEEVSRKHES